MICDLTAVDALTLRCVRDFLQELEILGAVHIDEQNRGQVGGQYSQVKLAHPVDVMVTALDDTIEALGTPRVRHWLRLTRVKKLP